MTSDLKSKTTALRRQHILDAAARTFADTGYQRTTIRDVARAAGVADGTIYNSFASKADILLNLLDPLEERFSAMPRGATGTPPILPPEIAALLRARWNGLTPEVLDLLRVVLSEGLVDRPLGAALLTRVLNPAIDPLEQALAGGGIADPAFAARTAVATFLGLAVLRMLGDPLLEAETDTVPERLAALLQSKPGGKDIA